MGVVPTDRWPFVISSVGLILVVSLLVESAVFVTTSAMGYSAFVVGVVTSFPFAVGVTYSGWWLARTDLPAERYEQVGRWWAAGSAGSVLLVSVINVQIQPLSALLIVGTVRWSAAVGGGIGFLAGVLQARAVVRGMEAERARQRRRQTEREREYLEVFAKVLTHELQNPLHVAQGHLELLQEEYDSPHADTVAEAQREMSAVIEETVKLARINETINETERVDLAAVARVAWDAVGSADATLDVAATLTLRAGKDHLQDLLEELFRNATEHAGTDAIVRVGVLKNGAGFYIADDGPGIPESDHEAVFTPGYAGPDDNTGLGLGFVARIAEGHGWNVAVTESWAGGARFEFSGVEQNG